MVHVRVDENIKAQATETLAAMGLTVSNAGRQLHITFTLRHSGELIRVIHKTKVCKHVAETPLHCNPFNFS